LHAGIKIQCLNQLGDSPTPVDGKPPTFNFRCMPIAPVDGLSDCYIV
jgi:hypothetical protein